MVERRGLEMRERGERVKRGEGDARIKDTIIPLIRAHTAGLQIHHRAIMRIAAEWTRPIKTFTAPAHVFAVEDLFSSACLIHLRLPRAGKERRGCGNVWEQLTPASSSCLFSLNSTRSRSTPLSPSSPPLPSLCSWAFALCPVFIFSAFKRKDGLQYGIPPIHPA